MDPSNCRGGPLIIVDPIPFPMPQVYNMTNNFTEGDFSYKKKLIPLNTTANFS